MSTDNSMDVDEIEGEEAAVAGGGEGVVGVTRGQPHAYTLGSEEEQRRKLGAPFEKYDIGSASLQQLFDPLSENNQQQQQQQLINLDNVLGGLKAADDPFLPGQIYIRNCMRLIFGYFRDDVLKKNSNRVLLGSPGVGKSVLFFIAALYKAEMNCSKPVVYIRKTREEKQVSVFAMVRTVDGVRVFWCRDVEKDDYAGISAFRKAVAALFGWGTRECVVFLDGPRHDEETDLNAFYEYFCTSGGHPLPNNAQKDLSLWILDGWPEAETIDAFKLFGVSEEKAIEAYAICGGCMRDMVQYIFGDGKSRRTIRGTLKSLSNRVVEDKVCLVMTSTSRNNNDDSGNPDRLRTMFNGESEASDVVPTAIQIVDSGYVMQCLRGRLKLESYLKALKLGEAIKSGTVVGVYFEEIIHKWFMDSPPTGITEVCHSEGTGAEGVFQLNKAGMYWIPSIPNFANIDSAVVIGRVLYVFQHTKKKDHAFDEATFWQGFVDVVRGEVAFDSVRFFVVVMKGVRNTLKVNFKRLWTPHSAEGTQTCTAASRIEISCTSTTVSIDTTSADTVRTSAAAGFTFGSQ